MVFVIGGAVLALALIAHERISFAPVCSRFATIFLCGRQFCLPPALSPMPLSFPTRILGSVVPGSF